MVDIIFSTKLLRRRIVRLTELKEGNAIMLD